MEYEVVKDVSREAVLRAALEAHAKRAVADRLMKELCAAMTVGGGNVLLADAERADREAIAAKWALNRLASSGYCGTDSTRYFGTVDGYNVAVEWRGPVWLLEPTIEVTKAEADHD